MHHDINIIECAVQAVPIAHISDEVAHAGMCCHWKSVAHLVLLELVTAENDQPLRVETVEDGLNEFLAKRSCPTRDKYDLAVQHSTFLLTNEVASVNSGLRFDERPDALRLGSRQLTVRATQ
jgi:hypothetical protein